MSSLAKNAIIGVIVIAGIAILALTANHWGKVAEAREHAEAAEPLAQRLHREELDKGLRYPNVVPIPAPLPGMHAGHWPFTREFMVGELDKLAVVDQHGNVVPKAHLANRLAIEVFEGNRKRELEPNGTVSFSRTKKDFGKVRASAIDLGDGVKLYLVFRVWAQKNHFGYPSGPLGNKPVESPLDGIVW